MRSIILLLILLIVFIGFCLPQTSEKFSDKNQDQMVYKIDFDSGDIYQEDIKEKIFDKFKSQDDAVFGDISLDDEGVEYNGVFTKIEFKGLKKETGTVVIESESPITFSKSGNIVQKGSDIGQLDVESGELRLTKHKDVIDQLPLIVSGAFKLKRSIQK